MKISAYTLCKFLSTAVAFLSLSDMTSKISFFVIFAVVDIKTKYYLFLYSLELCVKMDIELKKTYTS